jgi:predicted O-linked N-acetylglucosamine transferase (SPINDLY family)
MFYGHTISKLFLGWIENLDRAAFDLSVFSLGARRDVVTSRIEAAAERFQVHAGPIGAAVEALRAEAPDVIVFPDIGMGTRTLMLGGLRLAPVQMVAWGHPVTTGLPTIDYFLSSELMEPPEGASHYSERLVRLPNLSIFYHRPALPPPGSRAALGLPADGVLYLCLQSAFKYLPRHDWIFAAIAAGVPEARLIFLADKGDGGSSGVFRRRLQQAFADRGLEVDRFCHFLPRLSPADYLAVNRQGDVYLDSLEWSGGNTTLEALACGLPVVTCPGRFMRGRHSYAMLQRIGAVEGIAADPQDYVRRAVRLGRDADFRRQQRDLVTAASDRLYNDRDAVGGLAAVLHRAIAEAPA